MEDHFRNREMEYYGKDSHAFLSTVYDYRKVIILLIYFKIGLSGSGN